jgi:hypothetical protein
VTRHQQQQQQQQQRITIYEKEEAQRVRFQFPFRPFSISTSSLCSKRTGFQKLRPSRLSRQQPKTKEENKNYKKEPKETSPWQITGNG